MPTRTGRHGLLIACGLVLAGLIAPRAARAGDLAVSLTTTAISGGANYYLEFQLDDGDLTGDGNNTYSVTSLSLGGGSFLAAAPFAYGGVAGDPASTGAVSLTDSSPFNDIMLPFVPGDSLSFDLDYTENADSLAPDNFYFLIDFGAACANGPVAGCNAIADPNANFFPSFLEVDGPSAPTGGATSETSGAAALDLSAPELTPLAPSSVPEPPALALCLSGLMLMLTVVTRRTARKARRAETTG